MMSLDELTEAINAYELEAWGAPIQDLDGLRMALWYWSLRMAARAEVKS